MEISGAAVAGGLAASTVYFPRGASPIVPTRMADMPQGFELNLGVSAMAGLLNVHDD